MSFLRRLIQPVEPPAPWPQPGPIVGWPPMGATFAAQVADRIFSSHPSDQSVRPVVGTQYQGALDVLGGGATSSGPRNPNQTSFLVPEPDNPKDPTAVRVCLMEPNSGRWAVIGYLTRKDVRAYRQAIDRLAARGQLLGGPARLWGGYDRGPGGRAPLGVSLELPNPAALALRLDAADGIVPAVAAPASGRPYATVTCPYCSVALNPLPQRNKQCPSCGQTIHVVTDPAEGIRLLLTEADAKIAEGLIEADPGEGSQQRARPRGSEGAAQIIAEGSTAVEVQVELFDGEPAPPVHSPGRNFPIRESPEFSARRMLVPGGCEYE